MSDVRLLIRPCLVGSLVLECGGGTVINQIYGSLDSVRPEASRHIRSEQLAHGSLRDVLYHSLSQTILFVLIGGAYLVKHSVRC